MPEPAHHPQGMRHRRPLTRSLPVLALVLAASVAAGALPARAQTSTGTGGTTVNPAQPVPSPATQPGSTGLVILIVCMLVITAGGAALVLRYRGTGPGSSG